ncbi:MAG: methionine synthase [Chloroflexi bacterium]|nr:MAG: methionine synthase [Chloroflexota bacterium]
MRDFKSTTTSFKPRGLATHIGSLPHVDPEEACQLVLRYLPEIPAWPQLPHRSFLENMYAQFSQGFPGLILEEDHLWVDREVDLSPELERLYDDCLEGRLEPYALSPDYAAGLQAFLQSRLDSPLAVKGQVTGPVSFGLVIGDQNHRPIIYDDSLAEAIARHLKLKASWQEKVLSALFPRTIIFLDEPYLGSLGSAFVAVPPQKAEGLVVEVLEGVRGLKGIHCCGNADWPFLLRLPIDILSLDAYNFGESLALRPAEVKAFLERGGVLAWGIIPNDEETLSRETVASLISRLQELLLLLSNKGVNYDILVEQSLITPSCGLASLSPELAERALKLTAEVSKELRRLGTKWS